MYSCIYGLYLSIYHSYGCNYVNVPGNSVHDLLILQIVGGSHLSFLKGHVFHHPKGHVCGIARMLQCYIPLPKQSMYGIFPYIYHKNQPNVGEYNIHGWYGLY